MKIHIICAGNTYRSRLAEAYLKSLNHPDIEVVSSGYVALLNEDGPVTFYAKQVAEKHHILEDMKPHWDQTTQERIDGCDIVVCVNRDVYNHVSKKFHLPMQTYIWDIPDITYPSLPSDPKTDSEILKVAEATFVKIKRRVRELLFFIDRHKPKTLRDVFNGDGSSADRTATVEEANLQGLWHRGVHLGLYTSDGKVLMQKRSNKIIMDPGKWDVGCGGGTDAGENSLQAAVRECREELGIHLAPEDLQYVFTEKYNHYLPHYAFHERCFVDVFIAKIGGHEPINIEKTEVAEVRIVPIAEARELLQHNRPLSAPVYKEHILRAIETSDGFRGL